MTPVIALAVALFSHAGDFARVFMAPDDVPGPVTFYFQNRREEATFNLLDEQGSVRPDAAKELSHFLRCWRTNREKPIHPRVIEVVSAISHHFGDARVEIISGYRAKPYGAPHSKHFLGRAMDIHITGVPAKVVAEWAWKNFRNVGVGYYVHQDFVHVDVRDLDVRWIDPAKHGEASKLTRYFGRPVTDQLPADAPQLAYDLQRAPKTINSATATAQLVPAAVQPMDARLQLEAINHILEQ